MTQAKPTSDSKKERPSKTSLTKTGWIFLVGCVVLYLASLTSQSGLLLFPIGILIGCFLYSWFMGRSVLKSVELTAPEMVRVEEGGRSTQSWTVLHGGKGAIGMFRIMHEGRILLRVGQMQPGEELNVVPESLFEKRGVHAWADLKLECFYPFGLLRLSRPLAIKGEAIVYPRVYSCPVPPAAGYDVMLGGKYHGGRQTLSGTQFAGIRPSQPGDPLKHIHWKSSSKGQGLMTRTYDEELSGRVAVIIDPAKEAYMDDAVRAAGSMIFAALDEEHHVELLLLGDGSHRVFPPFTDGQEILDLLARLDTGTNAVRPDDLEALVSKASRKSSLVFVVAGDRWPDDYLIARLKSEGRRVLTVMPRQITEKEGIGDWFYQKDRILN